ncbi:MAG: class I mannose-6-phosphate isomerase [Bacteriovoracaceae bacterium]|nr:class I mannose-6-phosphate isomerase [Bacteriovoracaceae bacterium]
MMKLLLKLEPALIFKIWGGDKLKNIKNIETSDALGETWEISTHPKSPSKVAVNKTDLNELVNLSYLLKYIDTNDNLSVQVHPADEYAKEHENELGKTECWLILDAEPGAGIYLGFKKGVTRKEFKTAVESGLAVDRFLNFYEVSPGDFFAVPAGAVHAIGKGVTLAEAQQSSGVTYRVWDWNRVGDDGKPRELHINKALDCLRFDEGFNRNLDLAKKSGLFNTAGAHALYAHADFKAELLNLSAGDKKEIRVSPKEGVTLLDGLIEVDGEQYSKFESAIAINEGIVQIVAKQASSLMLVKGRED